MNANTIACRTSRSLIRSTGLPIRSACASRAWSTRITGAPSQICLMVTGGMVT